jgi:pimeloyl-ACP methyl ester carboxylesterase
VELTALLQDLVDHWPVPVQRLALVGHSMGGLIMRAACAVDTGRATPWTRLLTDMVTLGTPHLGADLALGTRHGSALLRLVEETSGLHRILEHRSPGIRDLERGLPDLPPLPHVRYRLVSAEVGSPRLPLGRIFGDLLVRRRSAHGVRRTGWRCSQHLFPDADVLHVPRANHFSLLNHPDVDRAMRRWLA